MSNEWKTSVLSGGKTTRHGLFSLDARHYLVLFSHQIRIYFLQTRQCIKSINIDLTDVVDAKIDPSNAGLLLLFSATGIMTTINWKEKVATPSIQTTKLFTSFLKVISITETDIIAVIGKRENGHKISPHTRTIIKYNKASKKYHELISIKNVLKFTYSLDSSKLAFLNNVNEIVSVDLNEQEITSEAVRFVYKSPVTSLAISNDSIIAIGTASGAIQMLYGNSDKPQRLLKWHIDSVKSLSFALDSSYLLSGGLEKVLVFWQLDTDKTQFLPRLNGTIDNIIVDNNNENYGILLNTNENQDYEHLVLSSIDLVSRLTVNCIRPSFANNLSVLEKTKKKLLKFKKNSSDLLSSDVTKLRNDFTSSFEIHPITKQLYFYNNAQIQVYDFIRNEQIFVQTAAPLLQTGKVRSEQKLLDPTISLLSFTNDGRWMCTFDFIPTSEVDSLLSKDDVKYSLKFWKFIENTNPNNKQQGHWELTTKIVDPHGFQVPVISMLQAPTSYYDGLAFITCDAKGGVRLWRPRVPKEIYEKIGNTTGNEKLQQTAWTLRKARASGSLSSSAVSITWSDDSSIIILGHETSLIPIDVNNFKDLPQLPSFIGSRIRSLSIVENNLICLAKNRIISYDLLSGKTNKLAAKVNSPIGGKNLLAIDFSNGLIALATNYYTDKFDVHSKVFIFKADSLKPVYVADHSQAISSIRYSNSTQSFIFIDLYSRIGSISRTSLINEAIEVEQDLLNEMNIMLQNAQIVSESVAVNDDHQTTLDDHEGMFNKVINMNSFEKVFENVENVQLETLFERIMKVIN